MEEKGLVILSTENAEDADKAIIRAQAVRAESVGNVISKATKKALQVLKANDKRLGNTKNLSEAQKMGAASNKRRSRLTTQEYAPIIQRIDPEGEMTKQQIADALNALGRRTYSGKLWTTGNIRRVLKAAEDILRSDRELKDPLWGKFA